MSDVAAELGWGTTWPSLEVFGELARERRVVPVVRRLLADGETPIGVYRKLAKNAPGTFLLESAEHGGMWSRYSIVGAHSHATLTEHHWEAHWIGEPVELDLNVLDPPGRNQGVPRFGKTDF